MGQFSEIFSSLENFLDEKNKRYGNSALEPLEIFTKHLDDEETNIPAANIYVRVDDKLKRIKNASFVKKNDVVDLIGYLVLLCKNKGWENFEDLLD